MNRSGDITVVSVSWYSSDHLKRLTENLLAKSENSAEVRFMIIDNTAGADENLASALSDVPSLKIQCHDPQRSQRSIAHASALDKALPLVDSEYLLVIDPDVHVFRDGWDSCCKAEIQSGNAAVGAPYPRWKLGKIHDSPSVAFFFGRTEWFNGVTGGWHPFPSSLRWGWNFLIRKIVRLFGFATRKRLESGGLVRGITRWLESITGITPPDTGWRYSQAAVESDVRSTVFKTVNGTEVEKSEGGLWRLAADFELFLHNGKPFLTHMYSSGISYYRTDEGGNPEAWLAAISDVERELA